MAAGQSFVRAHDKPRPVIGFPYNTNMYFAIYHISLNDFSL